MATMRMYCPSLKENVEATITDGKRVRSKGGSFRTVIYGEYEGRKCLPKTVKADVFAQYGFGAEFEQGHYGMMNIKNQKGDVVASVGLEDRGEKYPAEEVSVSVDGLNNNLNFILNKKNKGKYNPYNAESKFDKLSKEIAEEYEEKGKTPEEAKEIGDATAAKIGRMKYGKKKFDKMGKGAEDDYEEMIDCEDCGWVIGTREEIMEDEVEAYKVERENSVEVICYACYHDAPKGSFNEDYEDTDLRAEAVSIGNVEGDGLLAVMDGVGEHKGFIELEDDDDEDSVEIGISDEEMNEIAEIKLGAENDDAGWVITHPDGLRTDSFRTKSQAEKYRDELKQNASLRTGLRIVKANANDEPMTDVILNQYGAENYDAEGEYHLNGEGCEYCSEERELNAEGYCSECVSYAESYSSESILNPSKMSKDGKLALGLTAIGIGLAMFKADKIAEWFNKR